MTAPAAPFYIRREAYRALPLLKRALIELKIQQGEIAFIEDAAEQQVSDLNARGAV